MILTDTATEKFITSGERAPNVIVVKSLACEYLLESLGHDNPEAWFLFEIIINHNGKNNLNWVAEFRRSQEYDIPELPIKEEKEGVEEA